MVHEPRPHSDMEVTMYLGLISATSAVSTSGSRNYGSVYMPKEFKEFLISYCNSARKGLRYWRNESEFYDHVQQTSYCWWKGEEEVEFYWWVKGNVMAYLNGEVSTDDLIEEAEYCFENRDYDKHDALNDLLKTIFAYKGVKWFYDGGKEDAEMDRDEYYQFLYDCK